MIIAAKKKNTKEIKESILDIFLHQLTHISCTYLLLFFITVKAMICWSDKNKTCVKLSPIDTEKNEYLFIFWFHCSFIIKKNLMLLALNISMLNSIDIFLKSI